MTDRRLLLLLALSIPLAGCGPSIVEEPPPPRVVTDPAPAWMSDVRIRSASVDEIWPVVGSFDFVDEGGLPEDHRVSGLEIGVQLRGAIIDQLTARDYEWGFDVPVLLVRTRVVLDRAVDVDPPGGHWEEGPPGDRFERGAIVIEIIDPGNRRTCFIAAADGHPLRSVDGEERGRRIAYLVEALLDRVPPAGARSRRY